VEQTRSNILRQYNLSTFPSSYNYITNSLLFPFLCKLKKILDTFFIPYLPIERFLLWLILERETLKKTDNNKETRFSKLRILIWSAQEDNGRITKHGIHIGVQKVSVLLYSNFSSRKVRGEEIIWHRLAGIYKRFPSVPRTLW